MTNDKRNPKSEGRSPKEGRDPKGECCMVCLQQDHESSLGEHSLFGFRDSDFFRISSFGLRTYFVSSVLGFGGSRFNNNRSSFAFPSALSGTKILSCTLV